MKLQSITQTVLRTFVAALLLVYGWSAGNAAGAGSVTLVGLSARTVRAYCCVPPKMGLAVENFVLGSTQAIVIWQIEHFGWPHTKPRPILVSLNSNELPCTEDCLQGTIVEAWAKCKSAKNVVNFKFPFVGRYGLVRKEYEYEDPC